MHRGLSTGHAVSGPALQQKFLGSCIRLRAGLRKLHRWICDKRQFVLGKQDGQVRHSNLKEGVWRLVVSESVVNGSSNGLHIQVVLSEHLLVLSVHKLQPDDALLDYSVACLDISLQGHLTESHELEEEISFFSAAQLNHIRS